MANRKKLIATEDVDRIMEQSLPEEDRDDPMKRFDAFVRHILRVDKTGTPIGKAKA